MEGWSSAQVVPVSNGSPRARSDVRPFLERLPRWGVGDRNRRKVGPSGYPRDPHRRPDSGTRGRDPTSPDTPTPRHPRSRHSGSGTPPVVRVGGVGQRVPWDWRLVGESERRRSHAGTRSAGSGGQSCSGSRGGPPEPILRDQSRSAEDFTNSKQTSYRPGTQLLSAPSSVSRPRAE